MELNNQISVLTPNNWNTWKHDMQVLLMHYGCRQFIIQTKPKQPDEEATYKEKLDLQLRKDRCYTLIYTNISSDLKNLITETTDGVAAWKILKDHFEPVTKARVIQLLDQFFGTKYQPGEDVGIFISRVKTAATRLQEAGHKLDDLYIGFQLIRWLPQEFQSTMQQIYRWKEEDFSVVEIGAELILEANRLQLMKQDLEKAENAYLSSFTSKKSKTLPGATAAAHGDPNGKNDYQKKGGKPDHYIIPKSKEISFFRDVTAKTENGSIEIWHQRFCHVNNDYLVKTSKNDSVKGLPRLTDNRRKPSVLHLKPFGCLAYAGVPKQIRKKFDMHAKMGIMMGYAQRTKGYRIWLIDENKLVETINVRFDENKRGINFRQKVNSNLGYNLNLPDYYDDEDDFDRVKDSLTSRLVSKTSTETPTTSEKPDVSSDNHSLIPCTEGFLDLSEQQEALMVEVTIPNCYKQAIRSRDASKWHDAMNKEINVMKERKVWDLVDHPDNIKILENRWVYTIKYDENNKIVRYKARLVARGNTQLRGESFDEVFSPVINFTIVRLFFTICVCLWKWTHIQVDITNAYLYANLDTVIYMKQPTGYEIDNNKVYSDFATNRDDRVSMGGFITFIDETPISWRTFKQKSVSLSTMEAEYVSLTEAAKEFIWLKNVIDNKSLNLELSENVMFCDNQAAIRYAIKFLVFKMFIFISETNAPASTKENSPVLDKPVVRSLVDQCLEMWEEGKKMFKNR
ncbi:retrovirus-related Pol polyprotein from transposon RE1 [Trichonephila clavipes]|uniref:Retrovirus-related Pol polyprotein from transposon RE1 n=1 Tax=Trichonephila clavipes TaxID=2585209 RepID=A0A8X6SS55_TRICX|nr:retrovirus-related Pol polyprotein from transposon RE1 [Trichonephila clavipes]